MGGGFGGMGMVQSHDAAAKALGMTSDELYTAVQGGKAWRTSRRIRRSALTHS